MARIAQNPDSTSWVDEDVEQFMSTFLDNLGEIEVDAPE
jgi:hypothetical protein